MVVAAEEDVQQGYSEDLFVSFEPLVGSYRGHQVSGTVVSRCLSPCVVPQVRSTRYRCDKDKVGGWYVRFCVMAIRICCELGLEMTLGMPIPVSVE